MNTETRGTLSRRGNISQITNAFVEEVNAFSNTSTGYIIVSYAASPGQQSDNIQMLRLNINRNTVILDSSGQVISLSEIRPQTWINAVSVSYTHLDVYKRQKISCMVVSALISS